MARHYYDLYCLIRAGVARRAFADMPLFRRVAAHREIYFHLSWVDYSSHNPGTFRLLPRDAQLQEWRRDYQAMRETLFWGTPPAFDEILETAAQFEREFNQHP
jgi:hypothetical protein